MDASFQGFLNSSSELQLGNHQSNRIIGINGPRFDISYPIENDNHNLVNLGIHFLPNTPFTDAPLLRYINEMLMEEDMEDQTHMLQESLDFQSKEKSFYEAIGEKYPPSPQPEPARFSQNVESPDYNNPFLYPYSSSSTSSDGSSGYLIDIINPAWISNHNNNISNPVDLDSRSKRNHNNIETGSEKDEEERSGKMPALNAEIDSLVDEFDSMLLNSRGEGREKFGAYREDLKNAVKKDQKQLKGAGGKRARHVKKQNKKKEVIDLRTLLINCAQAVAADDRPNANGLLKNIRQHSSPCGDANQRLAHYFSDALEARLAGSGSQIYKSIVTQRTKASDYLRAYYTSLASVPFKKISNLAANRTIINKARKAKKVHVIDFGILYGFQWPNFIQHIAERENGPPRVKITGIDFPQPGFKPAERVEDTGRRLARYAEKFNVPFEYNAIAQKWETIKIEDLKIEKDEFVAVTCMYRCKNLPDETVVAHSSRTLVLDLIRKINPDIFVHGIVNGTYSAPFFLTRFREVLYHFTAMFDMLEACVPREMPERALIEREIFAREAFNVVACEGWERVERPETYKQWQVRNMKAGFEQVSFDREIIQEAMEKGKMFFHKDFLIDEQSKWILLGWRGRIINAISCWKPV
ncbi:scarecrow-like protein 9 [Phtheirospermum japonicum]|uniref:Scarecrow-like protein 9 n=1 Tax=Phtheirospermum japonicum TaxID=374723 RepID=A0A830D972_9LAMI|nr:scarecrow-like protein 9 [Phtheirospermum japonicum]